MIFPKVSVLIPTYNQDELVVKAINSALMQDYQNIEVIVADDCSNNNLSFLMPNDKRVYYFRNDKNIGRVNNYRRALYEYATGDWVVCLDGDDYFCDKTFISNCIRISKYYEQKLLPTPLFIQAGDKIIDIKTNIEKDRLPAINEDYLYLNGFDYFLNFSKYNHFSHLATFYNRKKAIELGFYENDILSTDIESILKMALYGNIVLIKKVVGVWFHHGNNLSSTTNLCFHFENMKYLVRCKSYAELLFPKQKVNISRWYQKQSLTYIIWLLYLIGNNSNSWISLLGSHKKILLHCLRRYRFSFLSIRFLYYNVKPYLLYLRNH